MSRRLGATAGMMRGSTVTARPNEARTWTRPFLG